MGLKYNTRYCEQCGLPADDLQFAQPHRRFCNVCRKDRTKKRNSGIKYGK